DCRRVQSSCERQGEKRRDHQGMTGELEVAFHVSPSSTKSDLRQGGSCPDGQTSPPVPGIPEWSPELSGRPPPDSATHRKRTILLFQHSPGGMRATHYTKPVARTLPRPTDARNDQS